MLDGVAEWQYLGSDDEEAGDDVGKRGNGSQNRGKGTSIWGRSFQQASSGSEGNGDDSDALDGGDGSD